MYGLPKTLQTRADYDTCLAAAKSGEANARDVCMHFRGLITSSQSYVFDKKLSDTEQPTGEMPEYCISEQKDDATGVITRVQHKLTIDPSARIFELGYSIAEVSNIITQLEKIS